MFHCNNCSKECLSVRVGFCPGIPRLFSDRWVLSMTAIDGSRNLPYQAVSTSVRLASRPTLNNYHLRQGLPHTPHHTMSDTERPREPNRERDSRREPRGGGRMRDNERGNTGSERRNRSRSPRPDRGGRRDGGRYRSRSPLRRDERERDSGRAERGRGDRGPRKALAAALARAHRHPAPHDHLLGSSRPIRLMTRSPRMW